MNKYKKLTGGYIPTEKDGTEYQYSIVCNNAQDEVEEFPDTFRLWTSGVKNQQSKSTCVAHALTTMKEIQDYYDTKSKEKYSTAWIYLYRQPQDYKGEGMIIKEALANLKNIGVLPYSMFSENLDYKEAGTLLYSYRNKPQYIEEAKKHTIDTYVTTNNITEIKHSLFVNHSPVVIGINVYESFYNTKNDGKVSIPNTTKENCYGGHCMLIIGWTLIKNELYWVVQNSWGENWGDNGFCYMKADTFPISEMWTVVDTKDYPCSLTDLDNRWSTDFIKKCVNAGIISGFDDNTFRPTEPLTREQFCVVAWKILQKISN